MSSSVHRGYSMYRKVACTYEEVEQHRCKFNFMLLHRYYYYFQNTTDLIVVYFRVVFRFTKAEREKRLLRVCRPRRRNNQCRPRRRFYLPSPSFSPFEAICSSLPVMTITNRYNGEAAIRFRHRRRRRSRIRAVGC